MAKTSNAQKSMRINIDFVSDTTNLVKDLQKNLNTAALDFGTSLQRSMEMSLNKSFKNTLSLLSDLTQSLSTPGMKPSQYEAVFNRLNSKIAESAGFMRTLKEDMVDAFDRKSNQDAIKDMNDYAKALEKVRDLAVEIRKNNTRANTLIKGNGKKRAGIEQTLGIDFMSSTKAIERIATQYKSKTPYSKGSLDWMLGNKMATQDKDGNIDVQTDKIRKLVSVYDRWSEILATLDTQLNEVNGLLGTKGTDIDDIIATAETKLAELQGAPFTKDKLNSNIEAIDTINDKIDKTVASTKNLNKEFEKSNIEYDKTLKDVAAGEETLRNIFSQFGINLDIGRVVREVFDLIKSAFDFYTSLDSALNEIYIVSNLTSESVNGLTNDFINMAKKTGMSIDDVTRSAVLFYQQGLRTDEVLTMTKVTSEFAKVADITASDAADKLTAAVNGYCLAAEDASFVADKFNKVAAASAADINELSTAFEKAAAQANQAGVSMDNYLAYIATMVEATREAPENIGTSLKTIFSRMQQIKTGDNTEDTTDVNDVETALTSVGIALRDTTGQLRDLEEIFDELGPKWNSLDRNTQAYLGTIIAGTRQQSRFITLMQNWDRVLDLANQSANSEGMQALMHERSMESIASKMQVLNVAWQEFISNIADSGAIKVLIDGLTKLLDVFNDGSKPLTMFTVAVGALANVLTKRLAPVIKRLVTDSKLKDVFASLGNNFGKIIGNAQSKGRERNLNKRLQQVNSEMDFLNQEQDADIPIVNIENQEKLVQLSLEKLELEQAITREQANQVKLSKEEIGQAGQAIGMALSAMSMFSSNQNTSGLMGGLGNTIAGAAGLFTGTNPIGGAISLVSGSVQLFTTIRNWNETLRDNMDNEISKINSAVQKATNLGTGLKSSANLLKTYDELSKKVYLTTEEQETLNDTIQQLADTYEIDTATDAFGNLKISILEVEDAIDEKTKDYNKALDDLALQESKGLKESTLGFFNNISIKEYYDSFFSTNGTQLKGALTGIQDNLLEEERSVTGTVARAFGNDLKSAIYNEVKTNPDEYMRYGIAKGELGLQDSINSIWTDKYGNTDKDVINELYSEVDYLQNHVNTFSFDQIQDNLNDFYEEWGKANNVTLEQWKLIENAMKRTIYGNDVMLKYNNDIDDMYNKYTGKYYDDKLNNLDKAYASTKRDKMISDISYEIAGMPFGGRLSPIASTSIELAKLLDKEYQETRNSIKEYEKKKKELEKERKEFLQSIKEQYGFSSDATAKQFIKSSKNIQNALNKSTDGTGSFLASIPGLTDVSDLDDKDLIKKWEDFITGSIDKLAGLTGPERVDKFLEIIAGTDQELKDKLGKKLQKAADGAMAQLQQPVGFTFTQLGEELNSISEDLQTMNQLIEEFNDAGSITLDSFMNLAEILDNVNLDSLGAISNKDVNYVNDYINALHNLKLGYDEATGQITMNADALESLQTIQEAYTKSKLTQTRNELMASAAKVKTEIAYIDAQIYATQDMIKAIEQSGDATLDVADLQNQANATVAATFENATGDIIEGYKSQTLNMNNYVEATLNGLSAIADAWGKVYKAMEGSSPEDMANDIRNILKEVQNTSKKVKWEGAKYSDIDWANYDGKLKTQAQKDKLKGELEAYLVSLENSRNRYAKYLEMYQTEAGLIDDMLGKDLSKLGTKDDKDKTLDKYIGQLLEIYNILNRIQNLQHRLSTLESYGETLPGEQYGNYLQQRLAYTKELVDQYSFLTQEQKKHTNAYQDFIQTVDGLEGVFDFDKYGQIIVNWEKYNNLQNQSINGETTLKEKADDVYNTYTQMYKDLQGYQDNTIDYYKQVVKLQQEMIDNYINLEKQAANAIKEIYKKILDDRLEAIDKEIQALDDLRKERQRAVKDAENAKTLSGYQTDLQRALMDTSGSSASAALKAQQNIEDKLSQMAEDKYSQMLDDIKDELNDVKEELQNEFDELFEKQDWLYTMLDNDIMGDQSKLYEILQQTSDWNTMSHVERMERLDEWNQLFSSYADNALYGQKGIFGIYDELQNTKMSITSLDTNLQGSIRQASNEIRQTIEKWENSVTSAMNSISNKIGSSGTGSGSSSNSTSPSSNDSYKANYVRGNYDGTYTVASAGYNKIKVNSDVQYGTFDTQDDNGVFYQPDNIGGKKLKSTGAKGRDIGAFTNSSGVSISDHNVWIGADGKFYMWDGSKGKYVLAHQLVNACLPNGVDCGTPSALLNELKKQGFKYKYARGGFANFTGPAWLDGSPSKPEAVLNALQTEHFIKFTNALDQIMSGVNGGMSGGNTGTVNIENISFNVESMSSKEDGEKAFNAFVNKFKEIGSQKGLTMFNYKSTL